MRCGPRGPSSPSSVPRQGATYRGKRGEAVVTSDLAAGAARMKDFDALVIPGGHAPDKMRMRHAMVDLTREAMEAGKPVAAICHGPQLLISANAVRGRTLTCWPSIAIDVKNAGGLYVDKPVVEDGNLITSRKPDDVPAFSEAIIRALIDGSTALNYRLQSASQARARELRAFIFAATAPPAPRRACRAAAARRRP